MVMMKRDQKPSNLFLFCFFLPAYDLMKGMIKDTDEQSGEEIHRARSGKILSAGVSVPTEFGCANLEFLKLLGLLWRLHQVGMMDH